MKRRDFFRLSAPLLSTPFMLHNTAVSTFNSLPLFSSLNSGTLEDRFLVIIQLGGGNDGLNTVINPEVNNEGIYIAKRKSVHIPFTQFLDSTFNNTLLHPSMGMVSKLCEQGKVNIIQSVGYPIMNRSHFKATDLWLTGGDGYNQDLYNGWMANYLEKVFPGYSGEPFPCMPDPLGIQLRSRSQSLGFNSNSGNLIAVNLSSKNENYYKNLSESPFSSEYFSMLNCNDRAQFMIGLDQQAEVYGQRLTAVFNNGKNSNTEYGDYDLGHQLRTVARLVSGGCRTKIFLTELDGFDTHNNQITTHEELLMHLSESVNNFMEDLGNMGILNRALVVTFSEFGRKFFDNGFGTDHGTLAPMFVFGHPDNIIPGLSGPPILVGDENSGYIDSHGAPIVTDDNHIDYRDVFSSILKQWFGASEAAVNAAFVVDREVSYIDLINTPSEPYPSYPVEDCFPTLEEDDGLDISIVIPILVDDNHSADTTPPRESSNEPLQEITDCNYIDLKPGFHASRGSNVRIYPFDCGSAQTATLAVFTQPIDQVLSTEKVAYTAVRIKENKVQLIEKSGKKEKVRINLFPNPASDVININFNIRKGERKVRLEVLDIKGALIPVQLPQIKSNNGEYQLQLNVSHLTAGLYYLHYVSENLMETFKFIKA